MSETGLYKKILAVMKDVQYLQKDDNVSAGASSYKAISEEKVTESVRASLIKNGLVIFPIEQEHLRDDTPVRTEKTYQGKTEVKESVSRLSTVNTKYKIVDIDTGQFEILASSGTGVDTQDKGVGKAMTYSYKYLLLKTFAIPTGEDPDKISSTELDDTLKPTTGTNPPPPSTGQTGASQGDKLLTTAQAKKINDLCGIKHINEPQGKALLQERYKKTSCKELTIKEASDFISYLTAS